jgi:L-alanine-DL-glutamate epimerase-like enolase superfamily enzyme
MSAKIKLSAHIEEWELEKPFRIAGSEWLTSRSVVVTISSDDVIGRGEGQGVFYLDETAESMIEQVFAVAGQIENGVSREELLEILPAGGARNAIDCALWDFEAKKSGRSIWETTGISPSSVTTVFTIGLEDTPEEMAANAKAASQYPILKIKLDGDQPIARLVAIRAVRPDARIVVDANQGWSFEMLNEVLPQCVELGIEMVEQPLPRGDDLVLEDFKSPITLAADESCLDTSELDVASRRYDMINIKLDKTGGLTEALRLAYEAKEKGCMLMVGNMVGTSLSMAPSFVVAQLCDFVDIDGPLLLKNDRPNGLVYESGVVDVFSQSFWG